MAPRALRPSQRAVCPLPSSARMAGSGVTVAPVPPADQAPSRRMGLWGEMAGSGGEGGGRVANASGAPGRSLEVSARTVDEAVARALRQLGCGRDEVDVEVVHAGSPGRLLGFGAEPARVRVTRLTAGSTAAAPYGEEDEFDTQRARFGGAPVLAGVAGAAGAAGRTAPGGVAEDAGET